MTYLHFACSFIDNLPRLDVINYLLDYDETDITKTNYCGNCPLHYFSHILVEDDKIEKYKKILSKFVSLNPNVVHIQNHKVCL